MCEGGRNCVKYLKRRWNRKEGRGSKNFKKRGQAGARGGCLKKRRGWNPLTNYAVLETQFWFVKYPLVARICKNFDRSNRVGSAC